jgi:hypothetical protein
MTGRIGSWSANRTESFLTPQPDAFEENLIRWCGVEKNNREYVNRVIAKARMLACKNSGNTSLSLEDLLLTSFPSCLKELPNHVTTLKINFSHNTHLPDLPETVTTLSLVKTSPKIYTTHDIPFLEVAMHTGTPEKLLERQNEMLLDIQQRIEESQRLELINQQSEALQQQAGPFKKTTKQIELDTRQKKLEDGVHNGKNEGGNSCSLS